MCNSMSDCKKSCCVPALIGKILLVVGGINWGLVGVGMLVNADANWNVVNMLLGPVPVAEGVVYVLVGVAAIMGIFGCKCKTCMSACSSCDSCEGECKTGGTV